MTVAFIPVRGGSKSIPLKNIKELYGKPLVYWVLYAASGCCEIDQIYVATDSEAIKNTVESLKLPKVAVIDRDPETATDTASTESAMLDFATRYCFDHIVLIQATSPLLTAEDLRRGFEVYAQEDTDSVLSAVIQKRFHWKIQENGFAIAQNYNVYHRPRRQDFEGYWTENGAFYITSRDRLLQSKNRVSGNIKICEMPEESLWEIDEPLDWLMIEHLLKQRESSWKMAQIPDIKMFLTDCDGCLTDGGMYYSEQGDEWKGFHALDGMGFRRLREKGIITGIISGEDMELNRRRASKLKADILMGGIVDKLSVVKKLCQQYGVSLEQVAYVGDDINDLEVVQNVGFGCSVPNGVDVVKNAAKYVSCRTGGHGAVREIIDMILTEKYVTAHD